MRVVRQEIEKYINRFIMPEYIYFDQAHGVEHILAVIDKSIFLAEKVNANKEMAYVIAAYHDIGMKISRENHGRYGSNIFMRDIQIAEWFTGKQRLIMAQAIEDHSTSLNREPRTIYGKIIYQADKTFDAEVIIKRSILFGLANYQKYTFAMHVDRVYAYVNQKYGENGQVKLWIDIPEERSCLEKLQKKLKDKAYVTGICKMYIDGYGENVNFF